MSAGDAAALVARVLAAMPVIDGHNDLPTKLRGGAGYRVEGLDRHRPELDTDIPRLRAGGVGGQFWSVFVPSHLPEPEAVVATLEQIDAVYRLVAAYPDTFALARTAADVERAIGAGRIASLIGVEGGHSLAGSLGVLRTYARLGVRYVTLTHNDNTAWADSATDEPAVGGLNDAGRAIVAELNRLGILVDLSHVAATTQRDALAASTAPVIFSHSSARALNDHPRNVADEELRRLRTNGGVIQLTFVPPFISPEVVAWGAEAAAERRRLGLPEIPWAWPRAPRPGESAEALAEEQATTGRAAPVDDRFARWLAAHPRPEVPLALVADHVEHAREVAGVEHVGIGGDYDGVDWQPAELADVSGYPRLLGELAGRGWSAADLEALTGRNILRVLRDAEAVAGAA
ncbi:dipeptidase [Dactylosporangium sp. CA-092794]|uniref:dipeptidase n=1 Tax=Dactylosporangium sp. CA-092794 TaxID=3239929 RepID=UPI003D929529